MSKGKCKARGQGQGQRHRQGQRQGQRQRAKFLKLWSHLIIVSPFSTLIFSLFSLSYHMDHSSYPTIRSITPILYFSRASELYLTLVG